VKVLAIDTMNKCARSDVREYVKSSEGHYLRQIEKTARMLAESAEEKPIILLSGPSGSGKTTTAFRVRAFLCELGINTFALSMDSYFMPINDPRNVREADGRIDFESPKRLDFDLLNSHFDLLLNGEEFTLPVFDFANQTRGEGERFRRGKNELVIIEGIHALNPAVTGRISERAAGVYVSVRTRIKSKRGNLLHPSKIRLMRRLVRDKLFRGRHLTQTLEFFENVERGEKLYILPYKGLAEHNIDTFIAYEPAVYKGFLADEMSFLRVHGGFEGYEELGELTEFFAEIDGVDLEYAPADSLVREFAGGSSFKY